MSAKESTKFGDESEMVSSVGEFISPAYRTTVLRQYSRLQPPARGQFLDILRSRISPSRELKAVPVSYSRVRLSSSDLTSRLPSDSEWT
ncbi:hypothetical protein AVEN_56312-1 [Araneus ventricosus]|uniref:Uncharacterized protein n=1 Tax=Araneus ventricosus TaxID=182803 RepID=A0A4Y2TVA3_ARAVE|nr:hypothetical protein AVEN_56312-1 [Araneus ventricosus]